MGVAVGRRPVGRPPCMPEPSRGRWQRIFVDGFFEVGELSSSFRRSYRTVGDKSDARGVVSAVFKPPQAFDDDVARLAVADVAHNSAHGRKRTRLTVPARGASVLVTVV